MILYHSYLHGVVYISFDIVGCETTHQNAETFRDHKTLRK